jgi:hypothetical protein
LSTVFIKLASFAGLFLQSFYFIIFQQISAQMSHNVPAVYDVFAARIRALRSKDQGCKNVGGLSRGSGA